MTQRAKAVGRRGSWFATINDEEFPCVHKYWFNCKTRSYSDPGTQLGDKKCEELVSALREKKVAILCNDTPYERLGQPLGFKRDGYVALWSIDDVEFDEAGLRFRFVDRLIEL